MQFVLGQKPSCIYPTVPGLICLCSPPLKPPCIKEAFFMLLARLEDSALIRCDCMIMKRRNSMSERLTRHKRLRLAKFLISSKCHGAHLGSESQPAGISVLQWPPQGSQGYLPSKCWLPRLVSLPVFDIMIVQARCKEKEQESDILRGGRVAK